ncbi:MAG: DUF2142 domain-containing protein [Lachnospiraceae bacterium]|nr:DUF2142 domain-containing protein [Lachnospiraceae bacterium]
MKLQTPSAVQLRFLLRGGEVKIDSGKEYTIRISSDVHESSCAFAFRLNEDGTVWNRVTYLLVSEAGRRCIFTWSAIFLMLVVCFIQQKKKEYFSKPENLFLLLSLILCPLYLFCVPIFQVPDEVNHYVRAYGIVHGYFLSPEGGNIPIPDNLIPYEWYTYTPYILWKHFHMEINPAGSVLHNNVNMALYSPISYVFQVLGIGIADLLSNNTYILVLAGSASNIIGCTLLLYYAVKYIPYGKEVLVFISLLPMALQERASLSVDAITYAAVAAIVSFCLYMRHRKAKMNRWEITLMYLLIALVSSCKVVYFPAALLFVVIPRERFGDKKSGLLHKMVAMVEVAVFSMGWLLIAGNYLGNTRAGGGTAEKVQFIFQNPGRYLYILDKMFWKNEECLIGEMLGSKLGSLNIAVNVILLMFIVMLFYKVYYKEKRQRKQADYLAETVLLCLSLGIIFLIATSLYIQWTDISASTYAIEGLQGRYFLPVLPLICCGFLSARGDEREELLECGSAVTGLYVINILVLMDVVSFSSYIG